MRKIGIIGLGHVGAALAYTLVTKGIADELVLIDRNDQVAHGEKLDLEDTQAGLTTHTQIIIQDYWQLRDADIVVIAAGNISIFDSGVNIQQAELRVASQIIAEAAPQIMLSGFNGILLNITNPCDVSTTYLQRLTNLPHQQVLGTGTLLDTMRMRRAIAEELSISPKDVSGYTLGAHRKAQFTAWSTITVGTQPIKHALAQHCTDLVALEKAIHDRAWQIIDGKGFSSYGIAGATITLIQAIYSDAHVTLPVSSWNTDHQLYIGQPTMIGRTGALRVVDIDLPQEEQAAFNHSASYIQQNLDLMVASSPQ
ncbi:lactate/malate family dehydrogenase [Loigolactobacillus jiayinensis]|uniref:NAD(P)-binding domain-containing protein n=1 Tax=Loigolactobacillus jiayinensis TaxID=2486016 RepID=A0ABW1RGK7_9LACO|nr:L-lactate dehydrogenase [Loigolactobacillus jiayinensis]